MLDKCPTCRPLIVRDPEHRLTRLLLSFDKSLVLRANASPNDHLIDNLATGDRSPPTNTVVPVTARPNEGIHRTHEAMTTLTSHPIIAFVKIGTVLSCDMLSVLHRSRVLDCVPYEATYTVAALSSDWSTSPICENSTDFTRKRRTPWRNTTCVRSSLV